MIIALLIGLGVAIPSILRRRKRRPPPSLAPVPFMYKRDVETGSIETMTEEDEKRESLTVPPLTGEPTVVSLGKRRSHDLPMVRPPPMAPLPNPYGDEPSPVSPPPLPLPWDMVPFGTPVTMEEPSTQMQSPIEPSVEELMDMIHQRIQPRDASPSDGSPPPHGV